MAIEHKRLGKHGVLVSNICLGTMNFGWHTSQEESFKIMDRALELGINFFDTADIYGWGGEQGDTEEILGRWFAQGGGPWDEIWQAFEQLCTRARWFTWGPATSRHGTLPPPARRLPNAV